MSNGEWVVCPLNGAEGFRFKGEVYSISGQTASADAFNILLRREFDAWVTISRDDLEFFGIEPVKFVKPEPMELERTAREAGVHHGLTFAGNDVIVRECIVRLPMEWAGKKVKVIEVLE